MTESHPTLRLIRYSFSGAVAGALSAVCFALLHQLFISSIWFSVVIMMAVGALCGLCLAWSYGLLIQNPSLGSWIRYNGLFVAMLALLGVTSVVVFEPVTTISALLQRDGPPDELFQQALPMTSAFTVATTLLVSLLYRRGWRGLGAILLSSAVLVTFLGLNVSIIGLVDIPRGSLYLIVEVFGFIFTLAFVYTALFVVLERKSFVSTTRG